MRTVVVGPRPAELEALIERRRTTGADRYDEVWGGEYHMAPAPHGAHGRLGWDLGILLQPLAKRVGLVGSGPFNLGDENDYRVPDGGLLRTSRTATWNPTAALVLEIVSPGDETWAKLPFYLAHHVDEIVIVDPNGRTLTWRGRVSDEYAPLDHSVLLDVAIATFSEQIAWPPVDAD